jgi:hypothetical protein
MIVVHLITEDTTMTRLSIILTALMLAGVPALAADLPDPGKTPGATLDTVPNDAVASCLADKSGTSVAVRDPITVTLVCVSGYSKCIRNVPQADKQAVYESYGLSANHTGYCSGTQGCEVDHLISLELGGSNDQRNLWPQPYQGTTWNAHVKDQLENWLHKAVCDGQIPLDQAQREISANWIDTYNKRLGNR